MTAQEPSQQTLQSDEPKLFCEGCDESIQVGQHYMKVRVELDTRMSADWQPAVRTDPTVIEVVVHHPGCLARWAARNPILRNVFGC